MSIRARAGLLAIVSLGIAWGLVMHAMGWAQLSNYAQVRALARGHAEIDRWQWETRDKAWIGGHFYSVKAPGLAVLTLPAYLALDAAGAKGVAREAAANARRADHPRWIPPKSPDLSQYAFSARRAHQVEIRIEHGTPIVWALTLVGAVLPAVALLLLVRGVAERIEPGYGTAAAITLGLGTIVFTFAAEYFSHVVAATLGFAAFALLFREREGPGRTSLVGVAGLLAGLAVSFEYPLGLLAAILLAYAVARPRRLRRATAYAAGAAIGAAPALAFNWWALGSPLRFAYSHAVAVQGLTGHAVLGLNSGGFFGIGLPQPGAAVDLLVASRGLVTLTPVLVMAALGAVGLRKRGHAAEAAVIGAVAISYFLYNLAIGLASAYRRLPALTLALAIPSVTFMLAGALTYPLIGDNGTGIWANQLAGGTLEHTVLTVLGLEGGWFAVAPVLAAVAAAIAFAALATPRTRLGSVRPALAAVLGWAVVSIVGPTVAGDPVTPLDNGPAAMSLIAVAVAASLTALVALRYRERRADRALEGLAVETPTT
ncbi:MAG: hypothetical protein AUG48_04045 [Actinobacteria bacterium 13_1_20CM_3_68_9]|nr:MAG: hypothetical protein AUG48_04045 [Actinobacteria bacterium 13_1_20CM_3_68_9]